MNQLLSIVPLETLAGWPEAPNPPLLESLGLLIGIPLVAALVIIALVQIRGKLVGDYGAEMHAAAWAGDHPEATIAAGVPPTAIDTSNAPAPPDPSQSQSGKELSGKSESTGGASATW